MRKPGHGLSELTLVGSRSEQLQHQHVGWRSCGRSGKEVRRRSADFLQDPDTEKCDLLIEAWGHRATLSNSRRWKMPRSTAASNLAASNDSTRRDDEMITVLGTIGMDLLFGLPHLPAVGETVLTPAYTTAIGGKGANQAVAAAHDGGRVRFIGSAGADGFGNEARSLLRAEGIDLAGLATVDAATCVASVYFDTQGRNQIAVASGANLLTRADALHPERLASGDWLVLQMEIPSGEVSKAVALAKARSARVILNLAPALPVEEAALRQVDVLSSTSTRPPCFVRTSARHPVRPLSLRVTSRSSSAPP